MTERARSPEGLRAWVPVVALAFAAFVFNTSEFLPVGLLPDMAEDLHETVSFTGLVITGYAWVVALMSLPLAIATAKFERRRLLLFLLGAFAICHFAVLAAHSFGVLLLCRIGVALTHSVFWSIMTPLAARTAPRGKAALGLAAVMGGTIVATVLGVPIGTKLGHFFGWQEAFAIIGVAASAVFLIIWKTLPESPSAKAGSLKSLPVILKRPALLQLYVLTAVTILGQFTCYSYISPFLQKVCSMSDADVVNILLIFGLSGILGTVASSKMLDRHLSVSLALPLFIIAASLALIEPSAKTSFGTLCAVTVMWGAAMASLGMAFQTIVLKAAPDAADVATSLYSGIFNIGIGGGAFTGSLLSGWAGFGVLPYAGAGFVALSALSVAFVWMKTGSAVLPGAPETQDAAPD